MELINRMATALKPSETMAIKARATELKAQGRSIIDLSPGEPDIDTPEHIKEAARRALVEGKTKYTAANGIVELREALAEKFERVNGIKASAGSIIVTNGGKQAIHEALQVSIEPGDEVIIPAPFWVSYPPLVEIAGGRPVIVQTSAANGYKMTPEQLQRALSNKTRWLIMNSPSNPTGAGYTAQELAELGRVLERGRVMVLSDEVYEAVGFDGFVATSFAKAVPALADRTLTVNAFSKTYAMTGWRVGYATGPKAIIAAMGNFQSQTTSNINSIAQYAALAALKGPQDSIRPMAESFKRRMELGLSVVERTPGLSVAAKPAGGFFLFIRIEQLAGAMAKAGLKGSTAFINYLLEKTGVATVPGEAFGDDGAFRVSVAASDENVQNGFQRISQAVQELQG